MHMNMCNIFSSLFFFSLCLTRMLMHGSHTHTNIYLLACMYICRNLKAKVLVPIFHMKVFCSFLPFSLHVYFGVYFILIICLKKLQQQKLRRNKKQQRWQPNLQKSTASGKWKWLFRKLGRSYLRFYIKKNLLEGRLDRVKLVVIGKLIVFFISNTQKTVPNVPHRSSGILWQICYKEI